MRWSRTLIAPALMVLLVACGGAGGSAGAGDGDGGGESASAQSQAPAATAPPTNDDGGGGDDGGGDDGGGTGSVDLDGVYDTLTPPNSTETSKTSADGIIFAILESSDSIDSLKSFYEGAIPDAGLKIFSTTEAQGGFAWTIAESEASDFGGAVSIYPSGTGSTIVSVTIGNSN